MYGIKWESKITGYVGKGSCIFTKDEAQEICDKYDAKCPDIKHEVMEDK